MLCIQKSVYSTLSIQYVAVAPSNLIVLNNAAGDASCRNNFEVKTCSGAMNALQSIIHSMITDSVTFPNLFSFSNSE